MVQNKANLYIFIYHATVTKAVTRKFKTYIGLTADTFQGFYVFSWLELRAIHEL